MIKNILLTTWCALAPVIAAESITGAGASFPAPVYQKWTYTYSQENPGTTVTYQSLGSGAGLNQIKAGTVDFAGTDNPLTAEQQKEAGLVQVPMLTGGVVVVVNLPGIKDGQLKLSKAVLADIFLGKIKMWNDKAVKALNPGLKLPARKITVVHRADSSGTSFIFTNYLSKISADWREKVGQGSSVKWPVGIGGQKNPGVCNNVAKISGSIGYTEYTYATEAKLACATLENAEGKFVRPTKESFAAGASAADWKNAPGFYMELTNVPGEKSWPITGVTYILIRQDTPEAKREALRKYFTWCYTKGAAAADALNYVALPKDVVDLVLPTL
ncbi:MAG: phosphate ABC transporter substrate-binding protein PstS [Akkermansia sp.]|nr:phosphate ABC transporter substrate-binding protein PstS [Akkermansia sp.]